MNQHILLIFWMQICPPTSNKYFNKRPKKSPDIFCFHCPSKESMKLISNSFIQLLVCNLLWKMSPHLQWGSKVTNLRGRILNNIIRQESLSILSTDELRHWTSNSNQVPDFIDFFIIKNFDSCLNMSSDHTAVTAPISSTLSYNLKSLPTLTNQCTDCNCYSMLLNDNI